MYNKILVIGLIKTDIAVANHKNYKKKPEIDLSSKNLITLPLRSNTKLLGCLHEGIYEINIIQNYTEDHADSDSITVPGINTGTAMTITKKANTYTIKENRISRIHTANIIDSLDEVISGIDLVVANLGIPIEVVEEVIDICKKYNVQFLLYPVPVLKIPDAMLCRIDIIVANANEVEIITGMTIHQMKNAKKSLNYLLGKGVGQVILILGSRGIIFNDGAKIIHKTFPDSPLMDVYDDLFIGALSVYISLGKNIGEAVEFAYMVSSTATLE